MKQLSWCLRCLDLDGLYSFSLSSWSTQKVSPTTPSRRHSKRCIYLLDQQQWGLCREDIANCKCGISCAQVKGLYLKCQNESESCYIVFSWTSSHPPPGGDLSKCRNIRVLYHPHIRGREEFHNETQRGLHGEALMSHVICYFTQWSRCCSRYECTSSAFLYYRFNTFCSDACTVPLQLRVESCTAQWLVQWVLDTLFRVCWKGSRQAPAVLLENAETRRLMSLH